MSQTVGLYLSTDKENPPTLQGLAQMLGSFDALANEIAFVVDPSSKLSLRVQSLENESISIRSIVEFAKEKTPSKAICWAIIGTLLGWLAQDARAYLTGEAIKKMIMEEQIDIPEKEAEEIADKVVEKLKKGVGRNEYFRFLDAVEAEPGIEGVGILTSEDGPPRIVYGRESLKLQKEGFDVELFAVEGDTRTEEHRERLIVISPVLVENSTRRWRFSGPHYEFGAPIKDAEFLDRVLSGRLIIPMTSGVIIDATYTVKEENTGLGWKPISHEITEVHGVEARQVQQSFSVED